MIPSASSHKNGFPRAFTLAEIALTLGIVAGTALVTLALFTSVTHQVQRLKEAEAPMRPAKIVNPAIHRPHHPLPDSVESSAWPPDQQGL